jgi:hypothetical protein
LACPANAGIDNANTATAATAVNRNVRILPPCLPLEPGFQGAAGWHPHVQRSKGMPRTSRHPVIG